MAFRFRLVLLFLLCTQLSAQADMAKELCEQRGQKFRNQLKIGTGAQQDVAFYHTSPGSRRHSCSVFQDLDCQAGLKFSVDLTQQKIAVFSGENKISENKLISSGRLRGVIFSDKTIGYAETPSGTFNINARKAEAYHCSSLYAGEGMPFSIPFGKRGHFIHGLDANQKKRLYLGRPASGGCIRVTDNTACQLYASLKKCGKATLEIFGKWEGTHVVSRNGKMVSPETRSQAVARLTPTVR